VVADVDGKAAGGRALCVLCRVGNETLAIRVSDVHKVTGLAQLCRLPRLPAVVAGITQHRGRIVTVFDARALLFVEHDGFAMRGSARSTQGTQEPDAKVLVMERMQRHLALLVDAVDEIEQVRLDVDLPSGPSLPLRVAQHRGQAVFAVDADRLLERMLAAAEPSAGASSGHPGR
jgi:chemotaxis signal transduction protein